jgi:hypothetical protein
VDELSILIPKVFEISTNPGAYTAPFTRLSTSRTPILGIIEESADAGGYEG